MPPAIQTPAAELADLASWLDNRALLLDNLATKRMPPAVRAELKRHAIDARGRAVLARTMLYHAEPSLRPARADGFTLAGRATPMVATADHIPGSCEYCPVGGGGCGVCCPGK